MILRFFLYLTLLHIEVFASPITYVGITPDSSDIDFQTVKHLNTFQKVSLPLKLLEKNNYWVKLELDKNITQNNTPYILKIETEFGRYRATHDPSYPQDILEENVFHLSNSQTSTYYFKIDNITNSIRFDAKVLKAKAYFQKQKTKEMLYGISYGIMISAILYYIAFFIFNRYKVYLYYSITQLFMLSVLILITHKSFNAHHEFSFALFYTGFITFTSLFSASFLQLQRYAPQWNRVLFITTLILIIDAFTNIFTLLHIPIAPLMLIYILIAMIVYYKTSQKYILFYLGGWSVLIGSFVFLEIQTIFFAEFILEPYDLLHIVMPLESLILAFALSYKMYLLENEKTIKERMLVEFDKRASIGDMLDTIAHQWRQPLTHIGYLVMNISGAIRNNRFDTNFWSKKESEINLQIEYMSQTITDFRDFYKPTHTKCEFNLYETVTKTYAMVKSTLLLDEIAFVIEGEQNVTLFGNESELRQVLLNLIHNAKEAFAQTTIEDKTITIKIQDSTLLIKDNAGGIPNPVQKGLFTLYTSGKKGGSGRGLYMSKLIIEEHFRGTLRHQNSSDGSIFMITWER